MKKCLFVKNFAILHMRNFGEPGNKRPFQYILARSIRSRYLVYGTLPLNAMRKFITQRSRCDAEFKIEHLDLNVWSCFPDKNYCVLLENEPHILSLVINLEFLLISGWSERNSDSFQKRLNPLMMNKSFLSAYSNPPPVMVLNRRSGWIIAPETQFERRCRLIRP